MEDVVMDPDFWKKRTVLVTGHTGFKGSWLSLWLQELGAELTGFSIDLPSIPCMFEVANVATGMQSINGDVRNLEQMQTCLEICQPEIVIHMAAQSLVRRSYSYPIETYSTNVMGTVNVLEAVRNVPSVKAVIVVTSDKCYENRDLDRGYREDDSMGGYDPYSSSKGCAEIVTAAYRSSYFSDTHSVGVATVRGGNVIGGGDWSRDRLIPDVVTAFAKRESVAIRNPEAIRPWQFVLDPLRGYLVLAEALWQGGDRFATSWNFGAVEDNAWPVSEIVERIAKRWGEGASWTIDTASHPHEAQRLELDCTKAKSLLNWSPRIDVAVAVDWTVEWYKSYQGKKYNMRDLSTEYIYRYQELEVV